LQQAAFEKITEPGTYLIEGAMGCGKTEAALAVAYRLIAQGHAGGLYFALPTQTTSNKIHERVEKFLRRIEVRHHDLRLAHGSAWLQEDFHLPALSPSLRLATSPKVRAQNGPEEESLTARDHVQAGRSWFASGKRALAGKVVILDEIHTYDLYTGTLLDKLVKRLRELNCTVLILSATLTARRREELLRAANARPVVDGNAYPLLTLAPKAGDTVPVPIPAEEPKEIHINTTSDDDQAIAAHCLDRAESGQCVLWIRNTVDEAQATYRLLKSATFQGGPPVGLLHARFPLWRRQERENFWLEALGKYSANRPRGCILVATQVVEQSVDIDADFLVTDLAPTDMLLQRIGRLWRHRRPNRAGRPEVLIQTSGLNAENYRFQSAAEAKPLLGPSQFVYAPYVLLRTFQLWHDQSSIILPADIRPLLEATYAEPAKDEPSGWIELNRELETRRQKLRDSALNATSVLRQPALNDEEGVQTRWNDRPTIQLLLATTAPVTLPDKTIRLTLADGTVTLIPNFRFDVKTARALHCNLVRLQKWAVKNLADSVPEWLARFVSQKAVLGIVRDTDGAILLGEAETGLTWHPDEGIVISRHLKPSSPSSTKTPEFDYNEPYD
jgi:CRISPR-associated endonuclease/helicase Cas3